MFGTYYNAPKTSHEKLVSKHGLVIQIRGILGVPTIKTEVSMIKNNNFFIDLVTHKTFITVALIEDQYSEKIHLAR